MLTPVLYAAARATSKLLGKPSENEEVPFTQISPINCTCKLRNRKKSMVLSEASIPWL